MKLINIWSLDFPEKICPNLSQLEWITKHFFSDIDIQTSGEKNSLKVVFNNYDFQNCVEELKINYDKYAEDWEITFLVNKKEVLMVLTSKKRQHKENERYASTKQGLKRIEQIAKRKWDFIYDYSSDECASTLTMKIYKD